MKKLFSLLTFLIFSAYLGISQSANAPEPTLETPYNTMYVHLYYLQPDTYFPELAAVTLSRAKDSLELIGDAIKIKQVFDANGLYVRLNQLPQEPDYIDSTTQKAYYTPFPNEVPDIYLERINGEWLFSAETVKRINRLHKKAYPFGTDRLLTLLPRMGQQKILGLATWQYLSFAIILLLGLLFYTILTGVLMPLIKRVLRLYLNSEFLEDALILNIVKALSLLALFYVIRLLVPVLQLPIEITSIVILALRIVMTILVVTLAIRIVRLIMQYALLHAKGTTHRMDEQLIPIIRRSLKVIFVLFGVLHILQLLDVNVTALIAGVSIGGLALALAAQDTVKNLIGSAMIFFDRPFQIGDYIIGSGVEGTVTEVGFRTTRILTLDTSIISVPNGTIVNDAITNKGVRVFRIYNTTLGITYDTPPDLIEKFIQTLEQIILNHPKTRKEGYLVKLSAFDASALTIAFRTFLIVGSFDEEVKTKQELMLAILRLAEQIGISFAFPSSTIYMATNGEENKRPTDTDQRIEAFLKDYKDRLAIEEDFLD